jgi:hypothetical protein
MIAGIEDENFLPPPEDRLATVREPVAKAMETFLDNRWWYRIWTVQEVVLPSAATFIWGHTSLDFVVWEAACHVV